MANIQTLLQNIMNAIYGEEVRGSIHDAIEAINDEVTEWTGLQDGTVTTAKLASNAVTTAKVADGAITRAKLNADVVDTTLAVSGAPADAKKTGDELTELKTDLYAEIGAESVNFLNTNNILNAYITDGGVITFNPNNRVTWAKLMPNTKYRLKMEHKANTDVVIAFYDAVPVNLATGVSIFKVNSSASFNYQFTTDSTHVYIAFKYWATNATTYTAEQVLASTTIKMDDSVADKFSEVNNTFDNYDNGFWTIRRFSKWTQGSLTNGQVVKDIAYRLVSVYPIIFDETTTVYIASGRRASFHLLNDDGTLKKDAGWQTGSYTIPANTKFRVLISATSSTTAEETALIASDDYTEWLTIKTKASEISKTVDLLNYSIAQHFTGAYLSTGGNNVPNNRIKYERIEMRAGDIVTLMPDKTETEFTVKIYIDVYDSATGGTRTETTGWQNAQYDYTIQNDGYVEVAVAPVDDSKAFTDATDCNECIAYYEKDVLKSIKKNAGEGDTSYKINSARHIAGGNGTPLTFLHFSDIHKDTSALGRIIEDAEENAEIIDDYICTGDMVANTAEQITSWWNPNVMTCIGNHDTASYSAGTGYNWTALSMADRDAYYISPFKSNWGITHTSGKSYYYKDYASAKVRLIVLDVMLYNDNGAEATEQTAWLSNLLSSAITNNLHVIIAVHAPHFDSVALESSFTRVGQTPMPYESDCTTPDVVIETVATAITNGLHFIGYICGHTHQDNIWKATEDGSQLMYCITCAIVSQYAQWKNSDMHRSTKADAFNLITIDTEHTLVKIIRGGGADLDDHMRTRKAICFNYSTGEIVGQVL